MNTKFLKEIDTEALRRVIKEAEHELRVRTGPRQLDTYDLSPLQHLVVGGIEALKNNPGKARVEEHLTPLDDDFVQYVYEAAVEMFYGENIWSWLIKQQWKP